MVSIVVALLRNVMTEFRFFILFLVPGALGSSVALGGPGADSAHFLTSELREYSHVFLTHVSENPGSPASAFGHVFLTFSKKSQPGPASLALSFSASVDRGISSWSYLYRGVTGGFMGTMTLEPLYRRLHEYTRVEQRSLVFFELKLDPSEHARLLESLGQEGNLSFPYYFFTDNCSQRIDEALNFATGATDSGWNPYRLPLEVLRHHSPRFGEVYVAKPSGDRVNLAFDRLSLAERQELHRSDALLKGESPGLKEFFAEKAEHEFRNGRTLAEDYLRDTSMVYEEKPQIEPAPPYRPLPFRNERLTLKRFESLRSRGSTRIEFRLASRDFLDVPDPWGREMEFSLLKTELSFEDAGLFQLESLAIVRLRSFGEEGWLTTNPFAFSIELNRKNHRLSLTPEISGGYGLPILSSRSLRSAILGGAGVVTGVRGLNGFVSIEANSILRFGTRVSLVKTLEARQYFGEGILMARVLIQASLGRFRLAVGPDYETSSRKGSLVFQFAGTL